MNTIVRSRPSNRETVHLVQLVARANDSRSEENEIITPRAVTSVGTKSKKEIDDCNNDTRGVTA